MRLVEQWQRIEQALPADWADARLELGVTDEQQADRAAALLGPLMPGRFGKRIRFSTALHGAGPAPGAVRRLLALLDENVILGELRLLASGGATEVAPTHRTTLVEAWQAAHLVHFLDGLRTRSDFHKDRVDSAARPAGRPGGRGTRCDSR